jgi:hypothetical protein
MDAQWSDRDPDMVDVLEAAAKLQQVVPDAELVGGSAAAFYAHHRLSFDHDHVLADLRNRFDAVLEALESEGDWVTNRVTFGKIILGQIGDIEAGVRQLIRRTPLEIMEYTLPSGRTLRVPTMEETLRVKAFLALKRNQTRDYLYIAALAETMGDERAGQVLARMDAYYADQRGDGDGVASQVARQLSDPRPVDRSVTRQLRSYKGLAVRWHEWADVVRACQRLSDLMLEGDPL